MTIRKVTCVTLLLIIITILCKARNTYGNRYNYFDDYLYSLKDGDTKTDDFEGSGSDSNLRPTPSPFGSKNDVCCYLGYLAGEKGYHCIAKFYAARILIRNKNRALNNQMAFEKWHGLNSIPNYDTKLMRTFEQCVASRSRTFHTCCQKNVLNNKRIALPHFDTQQRRRYEMKMKRIRMPKIEIDNDLFG